jgi:hypothetical protein
MIKILWKMPVAATAIIQGPFFKVLLKRRCEISFTIEAQNGGEEEKALLFEGVETFRCTHLASLGSIDHELFQQAYGTLISLEKSLWLDEIKKAYTEYHARMPTPPKLLHHLMICFDDGPCYEIIGEGFKVV